MNKVTFKKMTGKNNVRFNNYAVLVNGNSIGTLGHPTVQSAEIIFMRHTATDQYKYLDGMRTTDMETAQYEIKKRLL